MRIEVYPWWSVYIHLHEFHAVDQVHGYYQLRVAVDQTSVFCFDDFTNTNGHLHNNVGVSRPIKIAFAEQSVELRDVYGVKVRGKERFERSKPYYLDVELELWYLDPEKRVADDKFSFVSKRQVRIKLHPFQTTHCHRLVLYEYFCFSAVSLTIHTAVTKLEHVLTKSTPPPVSFLFVMVHLFSPFPTNWSNTIVKSASDSSTSTCLCRTLSERLTDVDTEMWELEQQLRGEKNPWKMFGNHSALLTSRIDQLFRQLIQLFGHCRLLNCEMLEAYGQQRMKRYAEGFLFVEHSSQRLLAPILNQNDIIFYLIRKHGYLNKMPTLPVTVAGIDVLGNNVSLIVEERYLPSSGTHFSTAIPTGVHSESCLEQAEARQKREEQLVQELSSLRGSIKDAKFKKDKMGSRSSERLHRLGGLCFPASRALHDEEVYERSRSQLDLPDDRLAARRMTDPGDLKAGIHSSATAQLIEDDNLNVTRKSNSVAGFTQQDSVVNSVTDGSTGSGQNPSSSNSSENSLHEENELLAKARGASAPYLLNHEQILFVEAKEDFKSRLHVAGFSGNLYSDQNYFADQKVYFGEAYSSAVEQRNFQQSHMVVFVHGLEGTSEDLTTYRNYLRMALPETNFAFLLSEVNQTETWSDLNRMAENLLNEIVTFSDRLARPPDRISFVAHSLGGLIVRALCGLRGMDKFADKLHALLTLNSPHCGVLYNQLAAHWGERVDSFLKRALGISILKWWKQSMSLEQLTMQDAPKFRDTFLYRLSQNGAFGKFKYVMLVGSHNDMYVPLHSALVEDCKASLEDSSVQGSAYRELVSHICEGVVSSPRHTTLIKYTVSHSLANVSKAQIMTGRPTHIAVVDDDTFVEKLIMISARKYFS